MPQRNKRRSGGWAAHSRLQVSGLFGPSWRCKVRAARSGRAGPQRCILSAASAADPHDMRHRLRLARPAAADVGPPTPKKPPLNAGGVFEAQLHFAAPAVSVDFQSPGQMKALMPAVFQSRPQRGLKRAKHHGLLFCAQTVAKT